MIVVLRIAVVTGALWSASGNGTMSSGFAIGLATS
jgi:hypothetical protein